MQTTITIIGFENHLQEENRLSTGLLASWPDHPPPRVTARSITEVIESAGNLPAGPFIVRAPEQDFGRRIYDFLELLNRRFVPIVLLTDDVRGAQAHIGDQITMICPLGEEPGRLAVRLHALAARQSCVNRLADDLRLTRRFHGGLTGEMTRLQDELQLAAIVQAELLPKKIPIVGQTRFSILFRPAGYVSGDVYDIVKLDEHTVAFFLADAVGHGVPAALMTMVIMRSLHMKDVMEDQYRIIPPREVLGRLNMELLRHQQRHGGRFATAVYGIVDTRDNRVTIAGAGHPLPMRINANGDIRRVETSGGLLGVFPEEQYDEVSFTLEPDERLIIFSDGFETAFPLENADEFQRRVPTERYVDQFVEVCRLNLSVGGTLDDLLGRLDKQVGSLHQIDDLTAICLGLVGAAEAVTSAAAA